MTYYKTPPIRVLHALGDDYPTQTVIIGGFGRGGTTVLRQIVFGLGVDMREGISYEQDGQRINALGNLAKQREILKQRSSSPLWGWKDVFLMEYLEDVLDLLPNPRLLLSFRDPLATAQRAQLENPERNLLQTMRDLCNHGHTMLDSIGHLRRAGMPIALVSYEKVCTYPVEAVEQIADFLKLRPTPAALNAIKCGRGYTEIEGEPK